MFVILHIAGYPIGAIKLLSLHAIWEKLSNHACVSMVVTHIYMKIERKWFRGDQLCLEITLVL